MSAWANVARLVKLKNLDGGLVVKSTTGLSLFLQVGTEVSFVPPTLEGPRSATIKEIRGQDPLTAVVIFDGVDSVETAQELVGSYCLINVERYPDYPIESDESTDQSLVGYSFEDEVVGDVGRVKSLDVGGPQALLVVEGKTGEVLVPYVDDIIIAVDHESRLITARLPKGLLEL